MELSNVMKYFERSPSKLVFEPESGEAFPGYVLKVKKKRKKKT